MNLRRKRRSGGFTLIEVLLVLVILVVLASLAAVSYTGMHKKALKNAAKTEIETITQACELYQLDMGQYPSNLQDLRATPAGGTPGKWNGPYLKRDIHADPWGKQYSYQVGGPHNPDSFDIGTTTPDGEEIGNWSTQGAAN